MTGFKAEETFEVGEIIWVSPPGRICKYGIEARIDAISKESCTYTLLDEQETFTVKTLVLKEPEY